MSFIRTRLNFGPRVAGGTRSDCSDLRTHWEEAHPVDTIADNTIIDNSFAEVSLIKVNRNVKCRAREELFIPTRTPPAFSLQNFTLKLSTFASA
jgi:hypothetical protein